jgi:gliding-associated putative ABC transporter substrate-binding component GldG
MDNKKLLANRTNFVLFIVIVIGFVGVINYLSSQFFARADLTNAKQYTISKGSRKMLRGLDDLVTVKVYLSEKELPPLAQNLVSSIKDVLAEYKAYGKGNIRVIYRDPSEDNEIKNEARSMGLQEVPMQVVEKDKMQTVMTFMGLAIMYGDKKEILPVLNNTANLEYDLSSRIMRLTRKEVKKIGFYFGNGQHAFTPEGMPEQQQQQGPKSSYNNVKKALQEQFEVVEVSDLAKGKAVPSDIVTLVVAGPNSLTEREKFEIDQFVMRGGKLIALIDAVNVMTYQGVMAMPQAHNSGDLFANYGAKVNSDIIADGKAHSQISYQVNYGGFMLPVSTPYPVWVMAIRAGFAPNNPALSGLENIPLMWPSSVELSMEPSDSADVKAEYLFKSTAFAKQLTGEYDLNPRRDWSAFFKEGGLKEFGLAAMLHGSFKSFYEGKPVPAPTEGGDGSASMVTSGIGKSPATSIVLIGESDFPSDGGSREGIVFLSNLAEWLTLGDNLIGVRAKNASEPMIDPRLSDGAKSSIRLINMYLMPSLVVVFGIIVLVRRRNRIRKGVEV